jgi:hypothetical protein
MVKHDVEEKDIIRQLTKAPYVHPCNHLMRRVEAAFNWLNNQTLKLIESNFEHIHKQASLIGKCKL